MAKKTTKMSQLDWIAFALLVIGGINWGLAIWDINLVYMFLGVGTVAKVVYGLIGLSAVYSVYKIAKK